jgi:hypothetical protein
MDLLLAQPISVLRSYFDFSESQGAPTALAMRKCEIRNVASSPPAVFRSSFIFLRRHMPSIIRMIVDSHSVATGGQLESL